jgi:hypothetical protein
MHNSFSCMLISILYMFRVGMGPSSGELIVSMRHLAYVTLHRWPFGVKVWMWLQSHRSLHTKRSSTQSDIYQMSYWYSSADDGHMAARNMYRIEINIHEKKFCIKLVIYKDYTEMHGQQNTKKLGPICSRVKVHLDESKNIK